MKKLRATFLIAAFIVTSFVAAPLSSLGQQVSPVAPRRAEVEAVVKEAYEKFKNDTGGKNADYIPYLAQVNSKLFGIAIVSTDNQAVTMGDIKYSFSIQSISKVYSQALAMQELGADKVFEKIGSEPKDRVLDLAAESGLVVILHCDVDAPFPKPGAAPAYANQIKALFKRHPQTTIIWAHIGVGRIVRPVKEQAAIVEDIIRDPALKNVYFDISWDEVAKYIVATPESTQNAADMANRYPDRFLFGTDEVAPASAEKYLKIYYQYEPFWKLLSPEASEKIRKGNYERIFGEGRRRVRNWEATHLK